MNRDYNKKGSLATSIVQPSSTVFSNPVMYLNNGKPIYGIGKSGQCYFYTESVSK